MHAKLLFGLCIVTFFCYADSDPRWRWGSFTHLQELHQKNNTNEICSIGQCVHWKDCSAYATISNATNCSNKPWKLWVCCLHLNGTSLESSKTKETSIEGFSANNSESARMSSISGSVRVEVSPHFQNPIRGSNVNSSNTNAIELDKSNSSKSGKFDLVNVSNKPSSERSNSSSIESDWIEVEGISKNGDTHSSFFKRRTSKTSPTPTRKTTRNYWREDYDLNPEHKKTKYVPGKTTHRPWLRPTWQKNRKPSTERKSSTSWSISTKKPVNKSTTSSTWKSSTRWGYSTSDPWRKSTSPQPKSWGTTARSLVKSTSTPLNWNPTLILGKRSTKIKITTTTPRSWILSTKHPKSGDTPRPKNRHTTSGEHRTTPNPRNKHTSWNGDSTVPSWSISTGKWSGRRNPNILTTKSTSASTVHKFKSTTAVPSRSTTFRSSTTKSTLNSRRSSPILPNPLPGTNNQMCGVRDANSVSNRRGRSGSLVHHPDSVTINPDSWSGIRGRSFQRIVGGTEAEPFSWPWVAALYRVTSTGGNRFLSAGSLINENFVLTAAHVFTPEDLRSATFVVMLGTHTAREAVAEHPVMSVLRHPEYERRFYYNDIALLRLVRPVVFSNYVMPVCLPTGPMTDGDLMGKRVTVMGWGDESYGGITSRVLKEASFSIVSRRLCNASYVRVASNRFPNGITNSLLCAGDPDGGKDACQGDSGGPLTTVENGRYTQIGIVSFGYRCGDKDYPGVYTRVASYLNWIEQNAHCYDHPDYYDDYYAR